MYCSKCGKKIKENATFCSYCGTRLTYKSNNCNLLHNTIKKIGIKKDDFLKYKKYIFVGTVIVFVLIYIFTIRCKAGFCLIPSVFNGEYCSVHTCDRKDCYNKVAKGKDYCYTHMPSAPFSANYEYTPEAAEDVLTFSDINISTNSSYSVCIAAITNNGKKTYAFIEVKGRFKDSSGTTLDTDWTYAVGTEGLEPGESATFRLSVNKNSNITKCDFEILDYTKK